MSETVTTRLAREEEKCGECGGSGEKVTERSVRLCLESGSPMEYGPCPACHGSGKATGEKK